MIHYFSVFMGFPQFCLKIVRMARLRQVVIGSQSDGLAEVLQIGEGAEHHDAHGGFVVSRLPQDL